MPRVGSIRVTPLGLHKFKETYALQLPSRVTTSQLFGEYKTYLVHNKEQHHYGNFEGINEWYNNEMNNYIGSKLNKE